MKKNDLLHFYRNFQIIDVTEQCDFVWLEEPKPCKAYLEVSDASGDFSEGETIQGQSSGATATVFSSYVDGGRVYVENVSGTFQEGETIQGQSSGQTATVDGFVPERSYPDNIIKGTFPDSIKTKDLDDSLDLEVSSDGAGYVAKMRIDLLKPCFFFVVPLVKKCERIYKNHVKVNFVLIEQEGSNNTIQGNFTHEWDTYQYNSFLKTFTGGVGVHYGDSCIIGLYFTNKFVSKFSIKTIRVLKLVI